MGDDSIGKKDDVLIVLLSGARSGGRPMTFHRWIRKVRFEDNERLARSNEEGPKVSVSTSRQRLYRSRSERMLFGVCGGLATYFDLDPTLVRLVFVLLTLATGIGLIVYIVMAIITPQDPAGEP